MSRAFAKEMKQMREEAAARALWKLKNETVPSLEAVIAGTPTGPIRDKMTDANIILHLLIKDI